MTDRKRAFLCAVLAAVLVLSLTACGAAEKKGIGASGESVTVDDLALRPEGEAGRLYENEGLRLLVPLEYDELLLTETPQNDASGELFTVTEKASAEAAGPEDDGAGWLFSIRRIDEETLHGMLCSDMSGTELFAGDAEGGFYVFDHPTDVRYVRESNEAMVRDQDQWTALNDWARTVRGSFVSENAALHPETRGNSQLDICLARAAYEDGAKYTLSMLSCGPLEAKPMDAAVYAERLMTGEGLSYEEADLSETPDGEYVVFSFPEDDLRFDFFLAEGGENYVRQVWNGDCEQLYKAVFADGTTKASAVMQEWYEALAEGTNMCQPG